MSIPPDRSVALGQNKEPPATVSDHTYFFEKKPQQDMPGRGFVGHEEGEGEGRGGTGLAV